MLDKILRAIVLKLLQWTQRDIEINHHWVKGVKVKLNTYLHKGYWYFGRQREARTMELFAKLIRPGDRVVEVGGHIGYISLYFSSLVGPQGHLTVFEPGQNNLAYTRDNLSNSSNVQLVEKGVGKEAGQLTFYEDQLTGQNNSFVKDFVGLKDNMKAASRELETVSRRVNVVTLDEFFVDKKINFIKIDVEGFEFAVLQGAIKTLNYGPTLMVEVQDDREKIFDLLQRKGYEMFSESGDKQLSPSDLNLNIFCIHKSRSDLLSVFT